ncbi:helix-turn-helix domain-containing protein [Streptomyces sp. V1I6]|uniref:helix-turn-helix domain-containing protein n=1 Tax=Streptomyces sp. V1I6 TaxID=3042273 RepID=UPI0027D8739F|nr:helix-turn-helix domain-containing protein [Streptomyces sp. V1I6]
MSAVDDYSIDVAQGAALPNRRCREEVATLGLPAALAGTSRETTKVLRDFADQHLIRLARGRITVLGPERLADHAD